MLGLFTLKKTKVVAISGTAEAKARCRHYWFKKSVPIWYCLGVKEYSFKSVLEEGTLSVLLWRCLDIMVGKYDYWEGGIHRPRCWFDTQVS